MNGLIVVILFAISFVCAQQEAQAFAPSVEGSAAANPSPNNGVKKKKQIVDERDGNVYPYVQIGDQIWLGKNLKYNAVGSYCYEDDPQNCKKFGRLYKWHAAMLMSSAADEGAVGVRVGHQGICPAGWHVPSKKEWEILRKYVVDHHGDGVEDLHLRRDKAWVNDKGVQNTYGFAAVGGGYMGTDGSFDGLMVDGLHWTIDETRVDGVRRREAFAAYISVDYCGLNFEPRLKAEALSVRCIADYATASNLMGIAPPDSIQWRPSF